MDFPQNITLNDANISDISALFNTIIPSDRLQSVSSSARYSYAMFFVTFPLPVLYRPAPDRLDFLNFVESKLDIKQSVCYDAGMESKLSIERRLL